jgi:hypothetical protein
MGYFHIFRFTLHGCHGVFPAHTSSSLGRVPEQVLQRNRLQIRSFRLQDNTF